MIKLNILIVKKILSEYGFLKANKDDCIDPKILTQMKYWKESFVIDESLDEKNKIKTDAELRDVISSISGEKGKPVITTKRFRPGDTIINAGQFDQYFIGVIDGEVEVIRDGQVRAILEPGSWCGEISTINLSARTADIRARHNIVSVMEVSTSIFEVPIVGGMFWKLASKSLATKLHKSWTKETKLESNINKLEDIIERLERNKT